MNFTVQQITGVAIVTLPKLDLREYYPVEEYASRVCQIVDENLSGDIVMDLSLLDFAITPVLAALVRAHVLVSRRRRKFAICCLTDIVRDVLAKVRLDRLFRIFTSREEALTAIAASGDFYSTD